MGALPNGIPFSLLLPWISRIAMLILVGHCLGSQKREHFSFAADGVYWFIDVWGGFKKRWNKVGKNTLAHFIPLIRLLSCFLSFWATSELFAKRQNGIHSLFALPFSFYGPRGFLRKIVWRPQKSKSRRKTDEDQVHSHALSDQANWGSRWSQRCVPKSVFFRKDIKSLMFSTILVPKDGSV